MSQPRTFATLRNGGRVRRAEVPALDFATFRDAVIGAVRSGDRICSLFGHSGDEGEVEVYAVIGDDSTSRLRVARSRLSGESFPSLTPDCPQAHLFERELAEQFGVRPEGHPWLKPVRFQPPVRRAGGPGAPGAARPTIGVTNYYRVEGDEIHEVAVGPVHAGIIEPGHFRFQCHGEHVFHLEISLGYQHRGVERALAGGPTKRSLHYMETLAGDTTVGHALAYCQVLESLAGCQVPAKAEVLRGIALELERLANHTGDLGALAGDVGFLPTQAYCGRLRGDFLNATALICGNRFGRGLLRPGGVGFDVDGLRAADLEKRIAASYRDVSHAAALLWDTPSVMARFEETGRLSPDDCHALGLVGPAARACGVERDVRLQFPFGIYRFTQIPVSTVPSGDVFARSYVRWLEIQRSVEFIAEQIRALPGGPVRRELAPLVADHLAVSLVEGWRGEICHVCLTDATGRIARYKVTDPSFHNWSGLAMALRDQQVSDFPLCNKSFNLSYCGHDL